jgi:hypothetical protein
MSQIIEPSKRPKEQQKERTSKDKATKEKKDKISVEKISETCKVD